MGVPFLGRLPIYQPIREGGDTGVPLVVGEPAAAGMALRRTLPSIDAARASQQCPLLRRSRPVAGQANKGKIPLIQVR